MSGARRAIDALEATLRREIAALEAGDFGHLVESQRLKEVQGAELEQRLSEEPGAIPRDRLFELKALIAKTEAGLTGAIDTTRAVAREIVEVRMQHSVASNYGPRGRKNTEVTQEKGSLNEFF